MSVKPLDLQVNIQNTIEVARLESFRMGKEINDARSSETKEVRKHIHENQDVPVTGETEIMTELDDKFDTYDEEKHINPDQRRKKQEKKNKQPEKEQPLQADSAPDEPKKDGHINFLA